jgi:riboflavin transporter FmnP
MTWVELVQNQLVDPFRIGLIIALVATAKRTEEVTGSVVPIIAGLIFVAVIIPATTNSDSELGFAFSVLAGLLANTVIFALVHLIWRIYLRFRK